jgi:hypothetical protein
MGFLSAYEGTVRVEIESNPGYWVELRKYVSTGKREESERALGQMTVIDGKPVLSPDTVKYRQQLLLAAIANWNLDDSDADGEPGSGRIWPIDLGHVKRLPDVVFDQLWTIVDKGRNRTKEEATQFPGVGVSGDQDGSAGSAEPGDVSGS